MNKKYIVIIIIVAVFAIIGITRKNTGSNETVRIGFIYALTGPASVWSDNGIKAAKLAVDEINKSGGINGKKIEMVIEDSKTDPKSSVSAFNKLASVDKVDVVVGDMWSFITNPLIPLAESNKIVLISPTVMNHSVEKTSLYFFTLGHTVESQEDAMRKFFTSNPDIKTVYNLCWNDFWGKAHTELLKKITTELKISIIGESCTNDFGNDYRTEVAKIKALRPDSVFITAAYSDIPIKALYQLEVPSKILTTTSIVEALRARNFSTIYTKNVWFMDWTPNQDFINKFYERYGSYPIMEAQNSYEVVKSIAQGLKNNEKDLLSGIKSVKYTSTDGEINFIDSDNITANKAEAKLYTVESNGNFSEVK